MSNRDEFSPKTKRLVALRASYLCSFPDCPQITAGPSDESATAVTMIGKAAHIHAAAAGGKRYLASMSPAERKHISNAIWMCATHADLIDGDDVAFPADTLRRMKHEHEASCAERQRNARLVGEAVADLIALGPDVVFVGDFLGIDEGGWNLRLRHFVDGDIHALIGYIERFDQTAALDRYVLVNFLGAGRELKGLPLLSRQDDGSYTIRCPVLPSATRICAADLPREWALSDKHDLFAEGGSIAEVAGVAALPQLIKTRLSFHRGESPIHQDAGARLGEHYSLLADSPWLEHFFKLEVIRQAAIPYNDRILKRQYTPLQCVEQVLEIKVLASAPTKGWLPIRVVLDVKGLGRWQHDLAVHVEPPPQSEAIDKMRALFNSYDATPKQGSPDVG
jgi:hypothetical protein